MTRNVLNCAVKDIYYKQIEKGVKRNEYRGMSPYWIGKLFAKGDVDRARERCSTEASLKQFATKYAGTGRLRWKPYTHICFHCAGRSLEFKIMRINIVNGIFVISFK